MKTILLSTILVLSSITFSQSNSQDSLELFYILDSYWSPPKSKVLETDDSPNYFQVSQGIGMITGRLRENSFYFYGEIRNLVFQKIKKEIRLPVSICLVNNFLLVELLVLK
tara:strand:- start:348 stop:680 length:333 start_codon:yes stop_codon:yes gene_type:complete